MPLSALPPFLLLQSLAELYGAAEVVLCRRSDDSWTRNAVNQVAMWSGHLPVSFRDETLTKDSKMMVECSHDNITSETLQQNYIWLSKDANYVEELPLRLDSNFVTLSRPPLSAEAGLDTWEMWENYKVKGEAFSRVKLGSWSYGEGLNVLLDEKWERRSNLLNATIVNVLLPWMNWNIMSNDHPPIGFLPDIMKALQVSLNFTQVTTEPTDGKWGSKDENGTWRGIIGDLSRGHGDISSAGLGITSGRAGAVDFSLIILEDKSELYRLSSQNSLAASLNVAAYLEIFDFWVWVTFATTVLVIVGFAALVEHATPGSKSEAYGPFLLGVWFPPSESPNTDDLRRISTKILFISSTFLTLMLTTCFGVDLIAHMTVGTTTQIHGCDDLKRGDYKVYTMGGTSLADLFSEDGIFKECSPFASYTDGCGDANCVYQTLNKGGPRSVFYNSNMLDPRLARISSFPALTSRCGITFREGSELREIFNYNLLKMKQAGSLERMHHRWIGQYQRIHQGGDSSMSAAVNPIRIDQLFFPMFVVLIGIFGSAGVAYVEYIVPSARKKKPPFSPQDKFLCSRCAKETVLERGE